MSSVRPQSPTSSPPLSVFGARLLVPVGLLVLTTLYFWPQVVRDRALYWGDIGLYFTPMTQFLRDSLRAGRIPLWNPMIFCGTPYVGNPQTYPLYPVSALLPFVSAPYFLNLTVALHVWLAGLGTFLFARQALGLGRPAALLSAVTFMFGGQLVSKEQFPNMVQAIAWLPWVLWRLDRLLDGRRAADALWLGLTLGLQLLAAHVQITVLTLYLATAYGLWRLPRPFFKLFQRPSPVWRILGLVALSGVVAAGLAAGQILPTIAVFRDAVRHSLSFGAVDRFYLPVVQGTNFFLPRRHGDPFHGDWSAYGNFWETCCYVGTVPWLLAIWGGVSAWRRGGPEGARFWTVVFLVGVWMALGGPGVVYHLAYWVLPGFRAFHDPARCLLWACFALSLLAGYGADDLTPALSFARRGGRKDRGGEAAPNPVPLLAKERLGEVLPALALLLAFADLAHFGRTLYPLADPNGLFPGAANVAVARADPDIGSGQARILGATEGVWLRFTNYGDYRQDVPGYQSLWADTLTPNLAMSYGLPSAYGYDPISLKNAQEMTSFAMFALDPRADAGIRAQGAGLEGALSVKYVAVCRAQRPGPFPPGLVAVRDDPTLPVPGHRPLPGERIYLFRNTRWRPRARLASALTRAVPLTDDGPDRVVLRPRTSGPDVLVLADTEAAGWQCTVDDRPAPVGTADNFLRMVAVPDAGPHRVVFTYRPTAFRLGLYLSLLTVGGMLGFAAFVRAGRRRLWRVGD